MGCHKVKEHQDNLKSQKKKSACYSPNAEHNTCSVVCQRIGESQIKKPRS